MFSDADDEEKLNNAEDIRKVIEKVEPVDSVHADEIFSTLDEISELKAAARRENVLEHKGNESISTKQLRNVVDNFNIQKKLQELPETIFKKSNSKADELNKGEHRNRHDNKSINLSVIHKPGGVETANSNPYLKIDNVTDFID